MPGQPALQNVVLSGGALNTLPGCRAPRPADAAVQAAARIRLRGQSAVCASVWKEAGGGSSHWLSVRMTATELPRTVKGTCLLLHCLWDRGFGSRGATRAKLPSSSPLAQPAVCLPDSPPSPASPACSVTHEQGPLHATSSSSPL